MILSLTAAASACAPYEAPQPTSIYQWQRQQDDVQRRLCASIDKDSLRYERDCAGVSH